MKGNLQRQSHLHSTEVAGSFYRNTEIIETSLYQVRKYNILLTN